MGVHGAEEDPDASALFELRKRVGVKMSTRSDDGQKFNIMHYACYFGDVKTVQELLQINDNSLVNDITDQSDSALTIALLSPLTEEETKLYLASLLYPSSNLAMCNNRSQNAIQIVLLKGRIGLLFHMLPYAMNVRQDFYGNTMLHPRGEGAAVDRRTVHSALHDG